LGRDGQVDGAGVRSVIAVVGGERIVALEAKGIEGPPVIQQLVHPQLRPVTKKLSSSL
jgi:hypothetical protein